MIKKQTIRDFSGRIIGTIETDDTTKNKTARDFYGRIVGYWDAKLDVTRDFYQRIVARGDTLSALIFEAEREYKEKNKRK